MAETFGITLIKRFTYRGAPEEFSNKYNFASPGPTTPAQWQTLADALIAKEKTIYPPSVTVVRAYGYDDTSKPSIWDHDYTIPGPPPAGTFNGTGGLLSPGDAAMLLSWETPLRTVKGKVVYLRKYFHGCYAQAGADGDTLLASQKTALQAFGAACLTGTDIVGFKLAHKSGVLASTPVAHNFVTTRTLKRRGKRPPT